MKRFFPLSVLVLLAASRLSAGLTYQFRTVITGATNNTIAADVQADGPHMRVEFTSGDRLLLKSGAIAISNDAGNTLSIVDPVARTWFDLDLGSSSTVASILKQLGSMKMSFANPKIDVQDLGDGGVVEGYPTHRYRQTMSFDINVDAMGQKMTLSIASTSDSWRTERLDARNFLQLQSPHTGIETLDKVFEPQMARLKGFPLKQVNKVVMTQQGGAATTTDALTTVTAIHVGDVAPSAFKLPAGLTKVANPLDRLLSGMGGMLKP